MLSMFCVMALAASTTRGHVANVADLVWAGFPLPGGVATVGSALKWLKEHPKFRQKCAGRNETMAAMDTICPLRAKTGKRNDVAVGQMRAKARHAFVQREAVFWIWVLHRKKL